ncbi:MAG: tetratricopeptide repeat protein [Chloroflexota bacterium]|nr:MAG: tetratricopeptide repeat protein [Chloroflexota bacterium]
MTAASLHDEGIALWRAGRLDDALDRLGRAVDLAPETARYRTGFGLALAGLGQNAAAAQAWRTALTLDPSESHALVNLANAGRALDAAHARRLYRRALAIRAADPAALGNLGGLEEREGRSASALRLYRQALGLDPQIAELWSNLGAARHWQGRLAPARLALDRAVALAPAFAEARWNRALTRLLAGDWPGGLRDHEGRWRRPGVVVPDFRLPRWQGEPLAGRRILLWGEQGYGDAIQFARLAAVVRARGAKVTLACRPRLKRLFGSLAGVDRVVGFGEALPKADLEAPLMSLPLLLELTPPAMATAPYLAAAPEDIRRWQALLPSGRPRIGIVWAGNPAHQQDRLRSLPSDALAPLWKLDRVSFVSLQHEGQLDDLPAWRPPDAVDLADAAAEIACLDLVIAADTAVAHLAGALGKAVWILLAHVPDWRWGTDGETTPWYASARLFRQRSPGDWDEVIRRVAAALEERFPPHAGSR